ncbi:hypothetical protein MUP01_09280 [Candidatus Bathyarchaeota archaeon]|nr:hypothetical protein [Candidatus Bathyarchaeota archaeon]
MKRSRSRASRVKGYLVKNPGAVFIVAFQTLLLTCAGLLVQGKPAVASDVAAYAYWLLVTGVILQVISFLRNKENGV